MFHLFKTKGENHSYSINDTCSGDRLLAVWVDDMSEYGLVQDSISHFMYHNRALIESIDMIRLEFPKDWLYRLNFSKSSRPCILYCEKDRMVLL